MLLNRERALATMERHGLDALVAATPHNVYYLSDYGPSHSFTLGEYGVSAAILPRDEGVPATLLAGEVDVPYLLKRPTWMPEVRMIGSFGARVPPGTELSGGERETVRMWEALAGKAHGGNRQELLARVLGELGLRRARIGFDDVRAMLAVQAAGLAEAACVDAVNVFREIRMVKTPDEVELIRRSTRINEAALLGAVSLLQEGISLREVRRHWFAAMAAQDAIGIDFTSGGLDRPWASYPDSYRLKRGDHVILDLAGTYERYWSDIGRTGSVGPPTARVAELQAALGECHRQIVPLLRPGASASALTAQTAELLRGPMPNGLVPAMHSIGVEVYDNPQLSGELERDDFLLEPGVVVNYETFYLEFGWGVIQLDDTYLIGDGEPQRLSTLPPGVLWS